VIWRFNELEVVIVPYLLYCGEGLFVKSFVSFSRAFVVHRFKFSAS